MAEGRNRKEPRKTRVWGGKPWRRGNGGRVRRQAGTSVGTNGTVAMSPAP